MCIILAFFFVFQFCNYHAYSSLKLSFNLCCFACFFKLLVVPCQRSYQYLSCGNTLLNPWWHHQMETFSALLALCQGNLPVTGEFPSQRTVMRSFDIFFDPCLNKQFSKQSRHQWFEMPSRPLWCHCNALHWFAPLWFNPQWVTYIHWCLALFVLHPEQTYLEAMSIIERLAGDLNVAMDRLLLNMAISYEEMRDYQTTYDYFLRWYRVCLDLYGLEHPKTRRPINTLREHRYQHIARQRGDPVPELPNWNWD